MRTNFCNTSAGRVVAGGHQGSLPSQTLASSRLISQKKVQSAWEPILSAVLWPLHLCTRRVCTSKCIRIYTHGVGADNVLCFALSCFLIWSQYLFCDENIDLCWFWRRWASSVSYYCDAPALRAFWLQRVSCLFSLCLEVQSPVHLLPHISTVVSPSVTGLSTLDM